MHTHMHDLHLRHFALFQVHAKGHMHTTLVKARILPKTNGLAQRGDAAPSQGEDDALTLASKIYMKDARQHLQSLSNSANTLAKVGEIPR